MRCMVISDIHANQPALQAVLADAPYYDTIWCLGDIVGYGPEPNECIEMIQEQPHLNLAGNHDWAVLGRLDLDEFNSDARMATLWTQAELTLASMQYLNTLPLEAKQEGYHLVHASPREPIWEYLPDVASACANFAHFVEPVCMVGHTHLPLVFQFDEERGRCKMVPNPPPGPLKLNQHRMILNPGSVGQPRDGDPRASYAILDTDEMTWQFHRVSYPVNIVQERMRAKGLPRRLVERLAYGK
ncbi:MAG: metallophosphoesterase family protein [Anaerolineales bacterium]|nr:metallophosphoesterase family protein [Anaerolineales bacterium]